MIISHLGSSATITLCNPWRLISALQCLFRCFALLSSVEMKPIKIHVPVLHCFDNTPRLVRIQGMGMGMGKVFGSTYFNIAVKLSSIELNWHIYYYTHFN